MNEENKSQISESGQNSKNILGIVISVVLTAAIVGGGVFAWQKSNFKSAEKILQKQIVSLQEQVKAIQKNENINETAKNEINSPEVSNNFDYQNLLGVYISKAHYKTWRLLKYDEQDPKIEIYKDEQTFTDQESDGIGVFNTLFFGVENNFVIENEKYNLRKPGGTGTWKLFEGKNIVAAALDSGELLQHEVVYLSADMLKVKKIDDEQVRSNYIFWKGKVFEGDSSSFVELNLNLGKDNNNVYVYSEVDNWVRVADGVDALSFTVIDNRYSKDKNFVYQLNFLHAQFLAKVVGANPETFKP